MPNISSRSSQLYTYASVSGTGGYSLDPFKLVGSDCNTAFNSLESLLTGAITKPLLYKGLTVADKDTGRRYVIQGTPTLWSSSLIDNKRIWTYDSEEYDPGESPTYSTVSDAYEDDIFIDSSTGNIWKLLSDTTFESVYYMSDLISGNISDTNYYPVSLSWSAANTTGSVGTLVMNNTDYNINFDPLPVASDTSRSGVITTTTQTIGGAKTFSSLITGSAGITISGGNTLLNSSDTTKTVSIGTGTTTGAITLGGTATQTINVGASGTSSSAKTVNIGSTSGASAVTISSGTGNINIGTSVAKTIAIGNTTNTSKTTISVGVPAVGDAFTLDGEGGSIYSIGGSTTTGTITIGGSEQTGSLNFGQYTSTGNVNIGGKGDVTIGTSDFSDASRMFTIYKTTRIGTSTNNKNLSVFGNIAAKNITSSGFARAGVKSNYSNNLTQLSINFSDGNTHYYNGNLTQTALTLSIANVMSDLYTNYNGGSFIITIKNSHVSNSDLTITLSDTEFYGFTVSDTVVLAKNEAMTYSGIIQGSGTTDCYLYGIIAPSAQNLMS